MACIIAHYVNDVKVMAGAFQRIDPHSIVRASRFRFHIGTIIISTNRERSSREKNLLVPFCVKTGNFLAKILNQIGQFIICCTFWCRTLKSTSRFILIIKINAIKLILIDIIKDTLYPVLRHSCFWEWVCGTADTQEYFDIWIILSQIFETQLDIFGVRCWKLCSKTVGISSIVILGRTSKR